VRGSTARRLAHGLWLAVAVLFIASLVLQAVEEPASTVQGIVLGLAVASYGTVGGLVARRRPDNPIGWLFCAISLALAVWIFGFSYASWGAQAGAFGRPGAAALAWIAVVTPVAVLGIALPSFLLVFPDGRLRSRRWAVAIWVAGVGGLVASIGVASAIERYSGSLPMAAPGWLRAIPAVGGFVAAGVLLAAAAGVAGFACLWMRYRDAEGERRQQLRLLFWMLVAMVAVLPAMFLGWFGAIFVSLVVGFGILFGIPGATAIAVLTFGLYDVGIVLKKTVVYVLIVGLLTLLIALVLVMVSPIGLLAGIDTEGSRPAQLLTGLIFVVLVLAATWRGIRRLARRIVYGKRATPYEAMAEFSERLGETYATDDVLPRMAEIVRASTGAQVTRVWLSIAGELRPIVAAPASAPEAAAVPCPPGGIPDIDGARSFPVRDRGELLGALSVQMPPAEPLSKTGEKLVVDLASQAGLVLRNVRLIEELQESRRRIVTAQDERARKLERDIHDGAQQQLVALSVKLGLAEQLTTRDPEKARAVLAELKAEATDALDNLRDLARGIYPPLLADQGLEAALEAHARKAPVDVRLDADGAGRFAAEVEAAVYFCCLEALQNVAKYANANSATIRLASDDGQLTFEVTDDGDGFDPAEARGAGLTNMRDRLEAVGGELEVRSTRGGGTTVSGRIPVEAST
jgi:signal transduction histidine kinase